METLDLHIKNMVCSRCSYIVEQELKAIGVTVLKIRLGHVTIQKPNDLPEGVIEDQLKNFEFEVLRQQDYIILEEIKLGALAYLQLVEKERNKECPEKPKPLSRYLSERIEKSYSFITSLFSRHENRTVEQYYILLRIERVKEMLDDGEFSLSRIASKLGYSSINHLSSQFKKITGLSVSEYKSRIGDIERQSLHKI